MTENNILGELHIQSILYIYHNIIPYSCTGENDHWLIVLVLEIIVLAILIFIFLCIQVCHSAIKRKFKRLKDELTRATMEQNEAYGLTTRSQQTRANVGPQTVQEQLTDSTHTEIREPEYDYIEVHNLSPENATNNSFCIEQNQSYAIITSHHAVRH